MSELTKITVNLEGRIETGPLQVNEDWPGIFIRGDHACYLSFQLDYFLRLIKERKFEEAVGLLDHPIMWQIDRIPKLLASCDVRNTKENE